MNVLVLYNADDPDAATVASYYADARDISLAQLCAVPGVDPLAPAMTFDDYAAVIQPAFRACLAAIPQSDEIDYVVTIRGLPYRIDITDGYSASLEAMLQVDGGVDADGIAIDGQPQKYSTLAGTYEAAVQNPAFIDGTASDGDFTVTNPYSASYQSAPAVVRNTRQPKSFHASSNWASRTSDLTGHFYVVTRLDGFDYDDARALVDRGSAADGTFPDAELMCMAAADDARGARDPECEYTTRMLTAAGFNGSWVTPYDGALSGHTVAAYFTGSADLTGAIAGESYVPGAIADNLTSFGALPQNFFCSDDGLTCPASEAQTSIARFVRAGATGAHGTVNEPLNDVFPLASTLLFYTFGYNLGESQLFAERYLYWQNLYLGDPLTTPYAERPVVSLPASVPEGSALTVTATHPDGISEIRVYVDGAYVGGDVTDSATLDFATTFPGAIVGDVHEVIAVAIATDAPVTRTGWPVPDQSPRPQTQGWERVELTITDALPADSGSDSGAADSGGPADSGATKSGPKGCGCAATGDLGAGWPAFLLGTVLLARRGRR